MIFRVNRVYAIYRTSRSILGFVYTVGIFFKVEVGASGLETDFAFETKNQISPPFENLSRA